MIQKGHSLTLNPHYLSGFVDGEGCFAISINRRTRSQNKIYARIIFEVELREDDKEILERIQKTLGCGFLYRLEYEKYEKWLPHYKYKVSNFSDICNKIIPFFKKYSLQGKKKDNFEAFCRVAELIKEKKHLTKEGVQKIREIRENINSKKRFKKV